MNDNGTVRPDGVFFQTQEPARIFSESHDKDLVEIEGGWLARNRNTSTGPMPTREGDVVFYRKHQLFRVWTVTVNDAQEPDPNVSPFETWSRPEAEEAARNWISETKGRIFLLQNDGAWVIREGI